MLHERPCSRFNELRFNIVLSIRKFFIFFSHIFYVFLQSRRKNANKHGSLANTFGFKHFHCNGKNSRFLEEVYVKCLFTDWKKNSALLNNTEKFIWHSLQINSLLCLVTRITYSWNFLSNKCSHIGIHTFNTNLP